MEKVRFYVENSQWYASIRLYARTEYGNGIAEAQPLSFEAKEEAAISEPFLEVLPEDAQSLMDALWQCGIRPTNGEGSGGQLAATQYHLEDMRKLVFKE